MIRIIILLICLLVYYNMKKDKIIRLKPNMIDYVKELEIKQNSLIIKDIYLVELLYRGKFLKMQSPIYYSELLDYINNFIISLNNPKQIISDARDNLERVLKHIQSMIFILPSDSFYLDEFYKFSQSIKVYLSKYYFDILKKHNIIDHTSYYLLNRSSENKYGFFDKLD